MNPNATLLHSCCALLPLAMVTRHIGQVSTCPSPTVSRPVQLCIQTVPLPMDILHATKACQGNCFDCMQSFLVDLKRLSNVSGLNSSIYSALTASFVLAGLTYIGLPSQTLTAIFGSAAEKGLEDIFLWQLIGTAVSMAVAPIAFTQQVRWSSKCISKAPVTCEHCNKMRAMQRHCNNAEYASAIVQQSTSLTHRALIGEDDL
jgi:hypothetical protein